MIHYLEFDKSICKNHTCHGCGHYFDCRMKAQEAHDKTKAQEAHDKTKAQEAQPKY